MLRGRGWGPPSAPPLGPARVTPPGCFCASRVRLPLPPLSSLPGCSFEGKRELNQRRNRRDRARVEFASFPPVLRSAPPAPSSTALNTTQRLISDVSPSPTAGNRSSFLRSSLAFDCHSLECFGGRGWGSPPPSPLGLALPGPRAVARGCRSFGPVRPPFPSALRWFYRYFVPTSSSLWSHKKQIFVEPYCCSLAVGPSKSCAESWPTVLQIETAHGTGTVSCTRLR